MSLILYKLSINQLNDNIFVLGSLILNNIKLSPSQLCLSRISVLEIDTPYSIYVELINYFGEKGFKILNTTPRLLETGENFCFVPFLTSMIPF